MSKHKIKSAEARVLEKALQDADIVSRHRKQAWDVLRESGLQAALDFVDSAETPAPTQLGGPVDYRVWGRENIDDEALQQMDNAARLPITVAAALMPDAHVGYGLPIGGVLATDNAIIPYAVGVDIACRMRLTVFDVQPEAIKRDRDLLKDVLMQQTRFGAGSRFEQSNLSEHRVLDDPAWHATPLLRELYDKAVVQLGTSGGGNHFVEWGVFSLTQPTDAFDIRQPGNYLALLSHSGSRGPGAAIADHYSRLAQQQHPGLPGEVRHLAWFDLNSDLGNEYWQAMQLAGAYASANHAVIHHRITQATGFKVLTAVENHHNFAWREKLEGRDVIVHRKGATPAGRGVLGVIPGSMGDPGYLVEGKGNAASINSAAHGAGRHMSRREAKKSIARRAQLDYLRERGVELLGGGLDEAPQAYKSIEAVMEAQADLVTVVGRFEPKIVRMASD
jgi:tRNA-splicing ligase RtcB (3'-phosphate/5'-hydroxy nucleic acid ligase)